MTIDEFLWELHRLVYDEGWTVCNHNVVRLCNPETDQIGCPITAVYKARTGITRSVFFAYPTGRSLELSDEETSKIIRASDAVGQHDHHLRLQIIAAIS